MTEEQTAAAGERTRTTGAPRMRRPKTTRVPRPPRGALPPRPPRRIPTPKPPLEPLSPVRMLVRGALLMVALVALVFVLDVAILSQVQHAAAQTQLSATLRAQLAEGTLPVSEGDTDGVLLPSGAPVALLQIPDIGLREVIVEGTDASSLTQGPGHRRDTVLPGQAGVSVVMGRAAAFGGPFSRLEQIPPGAKFTVTTGQGEQTFRVLGIRYAGDPLPPALTSGSSRLVLIGARGPAFVPAGVVYLDADLVGDAQERGTRQTTWSSLSPADLPLATDTSTLWALVFSLQFLIVIAAAGVWTLRRIGGAKVWIVFVPLAVLGGLWTAGQLVLLLPNLL
ncbi:MAG: sortase [Microbacterium sp.]|uniref:sortase n=1 Tax=Microbacterium sp. TaxID=51671 RepID=UPI003F7EEBAE